MIWHSILKNFFWTLLKRISGALGLLITLAVLGLLILMGGYLYLSAQLPDVNALNTVQYQVPLRVYTQEGLLIAEYGEKRRIPVALNQIPPLLVNAFIATEDERFWDHPGVDPKGLMRAGFYLVTTGKKVQGGSTITMQVARNFFLDNKKTFSRKFKEILLALKINNTLDKNKILELYLNKIYLGNRAYGVAAAAQVYYGETLSQLTLPQMAVIAGLPKAPSTLNPLVDPKAALDRRNHVLQRMYEQHYINQSQYDAAITAPITDAKYHGPSIQVDAPYLAEMVRNTLVALYGNDAYTDGFQVYTTIFAKDQRVANKALRNNLLAYDERHGYRGPEQHFKGSSTPQQIGVWQKALTQMPIINGLQPAVVVRVDTQTFSAVLAQGQPVTVPWTGMSWAKPYRDSKYPGPSPKTAGNIVKVGDVIRLEHVGSAWQLSQIPEAQAAIVALDPKNGAIRALTGGFDFSSSNFNRVTQAQRQTGSSFKPYIYTAALAKGDTLATVINDAPLVINDPSLDTLWRPQNDTHEFYGPTRLRWALTKSQNLVSIRLLRNIGLPYAIDYLTHFGFNPDTLPHGLSLALGTANVTPLEQARGYAVFANGGYRINPYFIEQISDSQQHILFQANPQVACEPCILGQPAPAAIADHLAPQAVDPQDAYLMNSALQDVIRQGTGQSAKVLERSDLAGKTGTTQDQNDAWFAGFNADLVTVAWVGFDSPRSLYEFGAEAALPIWIDFMGQILDGQPEHTMPQPPGIVRIRIDKNTGLPASADDPNSMFEVFREGALPSAYENLSHDDTTDDDATDENNPDQSGEDSSNESNHKLVLPAPNLDQLF